MDTIREGPQSRPFWRELKPADHACQIYSDESQLLETLTGFVGGALWTDEAAIVIASDAHLDRLDELLRQSGLNLAHFRSDDRYITLSAAHTLSLFMVEGLPDAARFNEVVTPVVARARAHGREVRGYGEMVAILWHQGNYGAAIMLEHLWNRFLEKEKIRLVCAYPKADFYYADAASIRRVKEAHAHFVVT